MPTSQATYDQSFKATDPYPYITGGLIMAGIILNKYYAVSIPLWVFILTFLAGFFTHIAILYKRVNNQGFVSEKNPDKDGTTIEF